MRTLAGVIVMQLVRDKNTVLRFGGRSANKAFRAITGLPSTLTTISDCEGLPMKKNHACVYHDQLVTSDDRREAAFVPPLDVLTRRVERLERDLTLAVE